MSRCVYPRCDCEVSRYPECDLAARPTPPGTVEGVACDTCGGLGWIDETLGGYSFSNPKAPCPDCDGRGELAAQPVAEPVCLNGPKGRKPSDLTFGGMAEPVAWMSPNGREIFPANTVEWYRQHYGEDCLTVREYSIPLYAAPVAALEVTVEMLSQAFGIPAGDAWRVVSVEAGEGTIYGRWLTSLTAAAQQLTAALDTNKGKENG